MSTSTATHTHIAYELIDHDNPEVVVIEFLSQEIVGPLHAGDLGAQLESLIGLDLPRNFVIDFHHVRSLGSMAFSEIAGLVRRGWPVRFCNLDRTLQLGMALIGLDGRVELYDSRQAAIRAARRDARRYEEDADGDPSPVGVS